MKHARNLPFHTRRDAWVEVNLGAIEHNTVQVRQFLPPEIAMMAVLKADAYGHGALMVVPTLEASGVSMLGVASMDEALQLRADGVTLPILVLSVTPDWVMHHATESHIQISIFTQAHLDALKRLYEVSGQPTQVQIKIDTGMNRIGVAWQEAADFIKHAQSCAWVDVHGVYTHFAKTDDAAFTQKQIQRWEDVISQLDKLPPLRHIANSAGTWHHPMPHCNMARLGISLFGYPGDTQPLPVELKPAMGLKARIVHLHPLSSNEGVSYGQTWTNPDTQPHHIATLPLGYADGIPRLLSNRIQALYQGQPIPQVGTITMDQLMLDVTQTPDAQVGDVVTLIGNSKEASISLTDWANILGTIEYELMCALRVRLPKTYIR